MADTTIAIDRRLAARPDAVFAAWTTPASFAAWFGSEADRTTMDVKPGGEWRTTMVYEGAELPFWGEFREITPPERLVLTFTDGSGPVPATVTVDLSEVDGQTAMRFTQVGALPEEQVEAATAGWNSFFDQLDTFVSGK